MKERLRELVEKWRLNKDQHDDQCAFPGQCPHVPGFDHEDCANELETLLTLPLETGYAPNELEGRFYCPRCGTVDAGYYCRDDVECMERPRR